MQIDAVVERHVREAFGAALDKDGDRMVAAFRGLDREASIEAAKYVAYVVGFVVNNVFRDGWTEQQLRDLGAKVVASEKDRVDLGSVDGVAALLDAAGIGGMEAPGVPPEDVLGNLIVCTRAAAQRVTAGGTPEQGSPERPHARDPADDPAAPAATASAMDTSTSSRERFPCGIGSTAGYRQPHWDRSNPGG